MMWKCAMKKIMIVSLFSFISQLLYSSPIPSALTIHQRYSPSWYFDKLLLDKTLGQDPCIKVEEVIRPPKEEICSHTNPFTLPLFVCDEEKASNLVRFTKRYLNECVKLEIRTLNGITEEKNEKLTPEEIKNSFEKTFKSNPYFVEVKSTLFGIAPLFKSEVIHFYCDDLSVPSRNCFFVAADGFSKILKQSISDIPMTYTTEVETQE